MGDRANKVSSGYWRRARPRALYSVKTECKVCGRDRDQFHDDGKCADLWLKKVDEEARKLKEGTR